MLINVKWSLLIKKQRVKILKTNSNSSSNLPKQNE